MNAKEMFFALFTLALLVVTFYFPMYGLGIALDQSKSWTERWGGVVLVLPSLSLLAFLAGMYPSLRGPSVLWLGIGATLMLIPASFGFTRSGFPYGVLAAVSYSGVWWLLAQSRVGAR